MKHKLFTLFLALTVSVGTIFADAVKIGDLYYNLDETKKTAEVTSENGDSTNYFGLTNAYIPPSVTNDGITYDVTSIDRAFYRCSSLETVTIPNSVTTIWSRAFSECRNLTSINVASNNANYCSVDGVLFNKSMTELIQYPAGNTRTSYTIPNGVTSIGGDAFNSCNNIASVTIPNSVTSIGVYAFYGCTGLSSITIPNSVTNIGRFAFYLCTSLTSITLPSSVTSIGETAFNECTSMTSINVASDNVSYCSVDGVLFNKSITELIQYPVGNARTSYSIPYGVTSIEERAFIRSSSLTSVEIPNSVTSIGNFAFDFCTGLTSVEIPNSVTSIGYYAFGNCIGLTSITIPQGVSIVAYRAFINCSRLTSVTIPNSVTGIQEGAFAGCSSLSSILIPSSVTHIQSYAFSRCSSLKNVTIPNKVKLIGEGAFAYCTSLSSITIPDCFIWPYAFWGCSSLISIYNFADTPQVITDKNVFDGNTNYPAVNKSACTLYVPAGSVEAYEAADEWQDFIIKPIQAAEVDATTIEAEPAENSVVITWPAVDGATSYTIELSTNDALFCTLEFNEQGQLLSNNSDKKSKGSMPKHAIQKASGWQYTVNGLESGTQYTFIVIAKNGDTELFKDQKLFTTTVTTTDNQRLTTNEQQPMTKFIRNGQLFIQRGSEVFNAQGARVE